MADLTPKQQEAAALIASGKTQRQAAEAVGVSSQTLTAWAKKEDFQRHVQALLQPAHEGVQTALQGLHQRAAEVLASLLETAPPATKLQAIRLIFEINKATPPAQGKRPANPGLPRPVIRRRRVSSGVAGARRCGWPCAWAVA